MSKRFKLDSTDLKKVGKGALLAIVGALLTYLTSVIGNIDWSSLGEFAPVVASTMTAGWGIVANIIRKWITNNQ